ncbi:hypothetical protein [Elizabethkingia anophelis]|uniref:BrnT family toxin n=1 Tax=Elizabethkingia anophelis TaxID=1117645 RepID=A0AAU8V0S9_9FLAO|nr:hypothetical protein [Elizabethkingia anophelis]AQX03593.1 hypothetical protein BBD32_12660 [Elizabethkingia anophelis]OPB63787.1 hypothetical protein BAY11_16830 [Elizabethkingia anophelis]
MKIKEKDYSSDLLGKDRFEVLDIMGEGFNFYPDEVWVYDLEESWWGRKHAVLLYYEQDIVVKVRHLSYYMNSTIKKYKAQKSYKTKRDKRD